MSHAGIPHGDTAREGLAEPGCRRGAVQRQLTLQRHFSALTKFSRVESRFYGRKERGKAAFDIPINPCVRGVCSRSVAVGLMWVGHG